ncbi:MAG: kelch repeat-containing protein [Bacteroidota bacterium]
MKFLHWIFVLIVIYSESTFAQYSWTQKSGIPYNSGRYSAAGFTVNDKAYLGLGVIAGGTRVYDFYEYNPVNDSWTQKSDYPGGGSLAATGFCINGKGYICLGLGADGNNKADLWEYNPVTDIWTQKTSFPGTARYGASCFVVDGIAYVGTGTYGNSNNYLFDLWAYDPLLDSWTQKASFPGNKRCHATAFSIGHFGFMGGGYSNSTTATKDFWKYTPSTNTWTACTDFPTTGRANLSSFVINNLGYVGLGYDFTTYHKNFFTYNPATNTWASVTVNNSIPIRSSAVGFAIGNTGYFSTGYSPGGVLADLWSYGKPVSDLEGTITYDNITNSYLSGVTVKLMQGNTIVDSALSDATGQYSFSAVPAGNYTIHCTSTTAWGGVNSTDAYMILKHSTSLINLIGIRLKAGDVNLSVTVNAVDALLCSKRFVNLISSFAAGDWIFEDPEVVVTGGPVQTLNFKGLCVGDVNGSYTPPY